MGATEWEQRRRRSWLHNTALAVCRKVIARHLNRQHRRRRSLSRPPEPIAAVGPGGGSLAAAGGASGRWSLGGVVMGIKTGKLKRVVVLCGAGVSVSAGIPDFRTPGSGLYDNLQKYNLPYPEAVFDIDYFVQNPRPFCRLALELWPRAEGGPKPTPAHRLIKRLHDEGLLVRCYTQNIDGLEALAGVPAEKVVQAHGGFDRAGCIGCGSPVRPEQVLGALRQGGVPMCGQCGGLVKPGITFFGEDLPASFKRRVQSGEDFDGCDLLIVMGTSLQVAPFSQLPRLVGRDVPRVLINREAVGPWAREEPSGRDVAVLTDCDAAATAIANGLGYGEL